MKKRRTIEELPLADHWRPPASCSLQDGVGAPLYCVATTFEFDAEDSVPLDVLRKALDFTEVVCRWSRSLPGAQRRLRESIENIRRRLRLWSNAPRNFKPRERPQVALVVNHPGDASTPARSVMEQLLQQLPRRVFRLAVMSPFVGQQSDDEDRVLHAMRNLPMARGSEGFLIVPEAPTPLNAKRRVVPLPKQFGQFWKNLFGCSARVLPVPLCAGNVDDRPRELHAKAVLVEGEPYNLLMIGSSNFTPHGMGISVFNCEANLVVSDKPGMRGDGCTLADRLQLPIAWDLSLGVEEVIWQDPQHMPEDLPASDPLVPTFFAWASYSQAACEIRVGIDRSQPEPSDWAIRLLGQGGGQNDLVFSRASCPPEAPTLSHKLPEAAKGFHVTSLRVAWTDKEGARQEGYLSVTVENREADLLPPKELQQLSVAVIMECLISGRTLAEWIEKQAARCKCNASTDAALDSLRAVDTSNYVLYRIRRFGRALAAMEDRIFGTQLNPAAFRYRLLRDPLGPVHMAERLSTSWNSPGAGAPSSDEAGCKIYALAELLLFIRYADLFASQKWAREAEWCRPILREAHRRIQDIVQGVLKSSGTLPKDLAQYLEACLSESSGLLRVATGG